MFIVILSNIKYVGYDDNELAQNYINFPLKLYLFLSAKNNAISLHKNPPDTEMIVGRYGNVKLEHSCVQSYILFTCEMRYADNARAKRHDTSQNDHSTKDKS